jgi:hypothetical protein
MNREERTIADVLGPLGYDSHMIGKVAPPVLSSRPDAA